MKIKCDLVVNRVVTASDANGVREEVVLRPAPDQPDIEGLSLTVLVACGSGHRALPAKGTEVELEMEWEAES